VQTLVAPGPQTAGFHTLQWSGETPGATPVAPGNYQLRLAGPQSGTTAWPAGARWTETVPIEVKRP
jgi:hypothetical protein